MLGEKNVELTAHKLLKENKEKTGLSEKSLLEQADETKPVTIRVWNTIPGTSCIGHVSLETLDTYVSVWPRAAGESFFSPQEGLLSTLQLDTQIFGHLPDHTIILDSLDAEKIKHQFLLKKSRNSISWSLTGDARLIHDLLIAGGMKKNHYGSLFFLRLNYLPALILKMCLSTKIGGTGFSAQTFLPIDSKDTFASYHPNFSFLNSDADSLISYQTDLANCNSTLAIDPKNTSALCGRGNALLSLDRDLEALTSFEAALAIDPKYKLASEGRLECLTRLGGDATTHKIKHLSDTRDSKLLEPIFIANFRDYLISTPHAHALAEVLITHPTLTRLYVDRTQLKDAGLVVLAEALSQNFRLITLTFKKNPGLTQTSALFQRQINAHLYRNRLLTAKQLTPKALHELDFSVLSGDDLRCVLERHPNMKYWNFSAKQLSPKTVVLQPRYLPNYPTLRRLNLSGNQLRNEGAEQIALLLKAQNNSLPGLQILELGNNRIQALGFRRLAESMHSRMVLEKLNLCKNTIQMCARTLEQLAPKFAQNQKLLSVILSGNDLLPSADILLSQEDKPEIKEADLKAPSKAVGFFHSQPIAMKSVIDPTKPIHCEQWVVALGCKKDSEHAMLFLEGMRVSGQRFLLCCHITAPDVMLTGKAKVNIDEWEMGRFVNNRERYNFWPYKIDRIAGEELQSHIHGQKESYIPFSKFYNSTNGTVNCTGWCCAELSHIDLNPPQIPIPSLAAKGYGSNCAIS